MLEIEDIKVADLNKDNICTEYDEEGRYIGSIPKGGTCVIQRPPLKLDLSVELRGISKELHEINKNLKLIAGRIR